LLLRIKLASATSFRKDDSGDAPRLFSLCCPSSIRFRLSLDYTLPQDDSMVFLPEIFDFRRFPVHNSFHTMCSRHLTRTFLQRARMQDFQYFVLARTLHVLGVVLWIGGVAFVTTVLIPSLKAITDSNNRLELFEKLEGKFSFQAKIVTIITGLSGVYMLKAMNAWERYLYLQFWWLHLMTLIWLIFTIVLFVIEPLFLHRWFHEKAATNGDKAINLLHIMHIVLLTLSLLAVFGAVAGAHGFQFF